MSGAPVNLNKFRKAKAKAGKTALAETNRAKFGRTKAQKDVDAARSKQAAKSLDGHKLDPNPKT